jgi:hypothetical protein
MLRLSLLSIEIRSEWFRFSAVYYFVLNYLLICVIKI